MIIIDEYAELTNDAHAMSYADSIARFGRAVAVTLVGRDPASDDRTARTRFNTRAARQNFLQRFERGVDPDGKLPPDEWRRRAEHAKRYMLRLAKRAVATRRATDASPCAKGLRRIVSTMRIAFPTARVLNSMK